jgi:hypothetical protein
MTNMLSQLVSEIAARSHHVVVAEFDAARDLQATLSSTRADILLLQTNDAEVRDTVRPLLYAFPAIRIVTIAATGRDGVLHELRPHTLALPELSADVLTAVFDSGFAGTTH